MREEIFAQLEIIDLGRRLLRCDVEQQVIGKRGSHRTGQGDKREAEENGAACNLETG
ncbi:hypothetical protein HED48_08100 [Ochrobactrum intermedium]|nr:hypothetical protein [Brucella intermedia]